ncbi:MAG: 50S ribosomal protein L4 [SAR202 cluster bacterium]|nr:50S ribosomal protein L4 [SAR202 cluster bacterium]
MELQVKNLKGEALRSVQVNDTLVAAPFNPTVVHQAMVIYQANQRQGTHSTKTRAEVSGGGKKPWRQKHTGRARQGSTRAVQWRHGGIAFGPKPRSYRRDLPKKIRHLALRCTLSQKVKQDKLVLVENFADLDGHAKSMAQALKALGINESILLVTASAEPNVVNAARNLPKVWTLPVDQLNAGEVLKRDKVIIALDAIRRAEDLWAPQAAEAEA